MTRFSPTCSKSFPLGNTHPSPAIDFPAGATQHESHHQRRWRLRFDSSGFYWEQKQALPLTLVTLSETLAVNLAAKFDRCKAPGPWRVERERFRGSPGAPCADSMINCMGITWRIPKAPSFSGSTATGVPLSVLQVFKR